MNTKDIIKSIPKLPGIYVFKDINNAIIYIGKAKCLQKRVSSYFKKQNNDWKIQELIKEHDCIEHIITKNETEALLLEAQLIGKFKPKYNVLLKSGNPFIYIAITKQEIPQLKLLRTKKQKATYFGPFLNKQKARSVYYYLTRTFKLNMCNSNISQGCLDFHLGNCAGNCLSNFNIEDYKNRMQIIQKLLEGNHKESERLLKEQIKHHNQLLEFEKSKHIKQYLENLKDIFKSLKTGFTEAKYTTNIAKVAVDSMYKIQQPLQALDDLQYLLNLEKKPQTIDCFDISHFQSSNIVGSCIRFTHGIPDQNNFRRFKIKTLTEQNDYASLQEIVARRYKDKKNLPDVILIDGGKGQLSAITQTLIENSVIISLAKKEELLYTPLHPQGVKLNIQTPLGQLLIAIRDYAHHFAISYHKVVRKNRLKEACTD